MLRLVKNLFRKYFPKRIPSSELVGEEEAKLKEYLEQEDNIKSVTVK